MKKYTVKNILNQKFIKIIFILAILILSIYFLYLFDLSETNTNTNTVEPFSTKYQNLCTDKKTHFYDIADGNLLLKATGDGQLYKNCEHACDENKCGIYLTDRDDNCYISDPATTIGKIKVNCNSNILPSDEYPIYNGFGYVNSSYFKDNSNNFEHIDYYLRQANDLKDKYNVIKQNIDNIEGGNTGASLSNINTVYASINQQFQKLASHLDICTNDLYTFIRPLSSNNSMNLGGRDMSYIQVFKEFSKLDKQNITASSQQKDTSLEFQRESLVYSAVLILTIITALLLILYKFVPDTISSGKMTIYFIGVVLMMVFVHLYLKV